MHTVSASRPHSLTLLKAASPTPEGVASHFLTLSSVSRLVQSKGAELPECNHLVVALC